MSKKHTKTKRITEKARRARAHAKRLHLEVHGEVYEFLHQPWRLTVFVVVMAAIVMVIAQLLYPADRALPFTRVQGRDVGGVSQAELALSLHERYDKASLQLKADDKVVVKVRLKTLGLTPRYNEMVEHATAYPLWQRLIPFSLGVRLWDGNGALTFQVNKNRLQQFVKDTVLPRCTIDAVSAAIGLKEGKLVLEPGGAGRECNEGAITKRLAHLQLMDERLAVQLPFKKTEPKRSRQQVEALFHEVQTSIQAMKITAADKTYVASRDTVLAWLTFEEDEKTAALRVGVNTDRIRKYLEEINHDFYIAPDPNRTALLDGQQQASESGVDGREIDIDATIEKVKQAVLKRQFMVEAIVAVVSPETIYERQYSSTDAGLEALLYDLVREKGDYSITVIELDGQQRRANAYGSQQHLTASTYKIFVAYAVLKEMEAGRIKPGQHIRDGMSFEACWDEMLKYSLNPCSWTFADMVGGWGRIQQLAHEQGMVNTFLSGYEKKSTSNDEALYFAKLERSELLQGASRERLLGTLRTQIYRSGIPAGTGLPVANKIGFYNGYLHDIGIVYAPQGRYVLGVMTYGGSWWGIADVARQVQEYLQQ